jgi:hypothetical protein
MSEEKVPYEIEEGDLDYNPEYANDREGANPRANLTPTEDKEHYGVTFKEMSSGVYSVISSTLEQYRTGSFVSSDTVLRALNAKIYKVIVIDVHDGRYRNFSL